VAEMEVAVVIVGSDNPQIINIDESGTPLDILKELELYPDEVIILSEKHFDKPIPIDTELTSGDKITIIRVASGG
jgi:sulfur carrier protein ThiS